VIDIIIVISRFLQRPQKRSRGNQLIHRRLSKTKSIGSGSNPESQAGRPSLYYPWFNNDKFEAMLILSFNNRFDQNCC